MIISFSLMKCIRCQNECDWSNYHISTLKWVALNDVFFPSVSSPKLSGMLCKLLYSLLGAIISTYGKGRRIALSLYFPG